MGRHGEEVAACTATHQPPGWVVVSTPSDPVEILRRQKEVGLEDTRCPLLDSKTRLADLEFHGNAI
jgi:hypothetical protein